MLSFYRYARLIAGLGLLTLLVGLILLVLRAEIKYAAWSILALGVFLLAIAFVLDFRRVSSAVTGRRGRFSTGSTVMVFVFIGIVLMVNTISIGNYHRFDVTGARQFTLTSQTKDVLKNVNIPVKALCFFVPNDPYGGLSSYVSNLLIEYQNYTNFLSVETIDPDEHPDQARKYGIIQYQSVVFETEQGSRLVSPTDMLVMIGEGSGIDAEHSLTSAILEVTGIVQKKVYFLTGHGETSISGDYTNARTGLLDNLYKVETLDIMITQRIPDDCSALIIAGPTKTFNSNEIDIIKNYLNDGGWLVLLLNPNPSPEIRQLLADWYLKIEDGTVIDSSSYVSPSMASPIVPRTRNAFGLSETYFPEATALIPEENVPDTIEQSPIVWTSTYSWLEKNYQVDQESVFNEGTDVQGPFALGVLILTAIPEEEEKQAEFRDTRIIVVGDSDFASNAHFYNGSNGELFLNLVNFLTLGKELITIERKVLPFRRLIIGPEETSFIQISSIALLPLLVLIGGGIIWWRRR